MAAYAWGCRKGFTPFSAAWIVLEKVKNSASFSEAVSEPSAGPVVVGLALKPGLGRPVLRVGGSCVSSCAVAQTLALKKPQGCKAEAGGEAGTVLLRSRLSSPGL